MPRKARIIYPGYLYHITQRGNNRQRIFFENNDYILYLKRIKEYAKKFAVAIYAYCLMENHVHFIAKPTTQEGLAKMFRAVNMRYAQYYQKKQVVSGHVWQGRFFSCLLSDDHIREAVRYVDLNPVRAQMVAKAWHYSWSSARAHIGKKYHWVTLANIKEILDIKDWKSYLDKEERPDFLKELRSMTKKNLALGRNEFMIQLEQRLNQKIIISPCGRPRKNRVRP